MAIIGDCGNLPPIDFGGCSEGWGGHRDFTGDLIFDEETENFSISNGRTISAIPQSMAKKLGLKKEWAYREVAREGKILRIQLIDFKGYAAGGKTRENACMKYLSIIEL